MAEVLSQSEIDALLSAVSTGDVDTHPEGASPPSTDWIAYDLTSQEKIIRSRFVGLEGIHDRFAALVSRYPLKHAPPNGFREFGEYGFCSFWGLPD